MYVYVCVCVYQINGAILSLKLSKIKPALALEKIIKNVSYFL